MACKLSFMKVRAMRNTINLLGIPIDKVTMEGALARIEEFLSEDIVHACYTPNSEFMMDAYHNPEFAAILRKGDMLTADSMGVILASRIMRCPLPGKVAGVDVAKNTLLHFGPKGIKFYFFGGKEGVVIEAADRLREFCPEIKIVGHRHGYFMESDEDMIVADINASGADILLVGLGAIKQETWIHNHRRDLKVKVCIGCGGSLDVFAGRIKRAPAFYRKICLEWLYRLYKEPWRFKRMLKIPKFIILTIFIRLGLKEEIK